MVTEVHKHQVIIVGGGMAGLRAALESYDQGADTAVLSQVHRSGHIRELPRVVLTVL